MGEKKDLKYVEIVDWVKQQINDHIWNIGEKMPSEQEICDRFHVSRQCVRHALDVLSSESLIVKVKGSGSYIGPSTSLIGGSFKKHKAVAVISTYLDHYIFPGVLRGIEQTLSDKGYVVQVSFTNDDLFQERKILENIIQRNNVDGIIVEPSKSALPNPNISLYRKLMEMNIKLLFFHSSYPELHQPCVRIDDYDAAYNATKLLIDAGHKKILGIFHSEDGQGRLRYAGYQQAMLDHNLFSKIDRTLWVNAHMIKHMHELGDYLSDIIRDSTAVVCYNDEVASNLINFMISKNIRVPEDVSVVGIDNSNLAEVCVVPITSFDHPKEQLGERLALNMIEEIENPLFNGEHIFKSDPVIRNSVKQILKTN